MGKREREPLWEMSRERISERTKFEIRNVLLLTHKICPWERERERELTNREGWWQHAIESDGEEGRELEACVIEGCEWDIYWHFLLVSDKFIVEVSLSQWRVLRCQVQTKELRIHYSLTAIFNCQELFRQQKVAMNSQNEIIHQKQLKWIEKW